MPIYQRKGWPKDKRRVVVFLEGRSLEQIHVGSHAKAKALEANLLLELRTQLAKGPQTEEKLFLDFCLTQYAPHARLHVSKSTWSTRKFHVKNFIDFVEAMIAEGRLPWDFRFSQWTTAHSDMYIEWRTTPRIVKKRRVIKTTYVGKKKVKEHGLVDFTVVAEGRTINNEAKTLRTMRSYQKDMKLPVPEFTFKAVPEKGKGRLPFWTAQQIDTLFRVCAEDESGRRLLPVLVFIANTGCRKGEAIHAERSWVNLDRGLICITPNDYWQPKNGKPREIPISDALQPYLELPEVHPKYLFVSSKVDKLKRAQPYAEFPDKTFTRLVKLAKLDGGPHMLRHSFASAFLAAEPDIFLLGKLMGHSHEEITEMYAHLLDEHLQRAKNKVNLAPGMGAAAFQAAQRWKEKRKAR